MAETAPEGHGGRTARHLLSSVTRRFAAAGIPTPEVDAELLLRHVTGWSRTRMLFGGDTPLPPDALRALEEVVRRREQREPLQLIVGSVGFRYLDLRVREGVFIPRPETEVLAGEAIDRVPDGGIVVEPCTGTGAIACSVAFESAASAVVATDVSDEAVTLAAANARATGAGVTVLQGDLLDPVPGRMRGAVDVLVSNPPYLTPDEMAAGEPEVTRWDPRGALIAGPSGHEVTDRLIAQSAEWLRPGGWLLLEVDSARADQTALRATAAGLVAARVLPDLTGADRIVVAQAPAGPHGR
ncbi:MAG: peptide chain release factor N(5)-glutamine methyltransferase [Nitriliruptorales bacterium]|nr:peptide chain release factor N(5)-glutamine methyltransferase [Nitriliruptorales bacterium]